MMNRHHVLISKAVNIKILLQLFVILILIVSSCAYRSSEPINFNTQIRPILNNKCLTCHGGVKQQADLSFLFPETAVLPAKSGKFAIVPGKISQSELVHRIKHSNPELRMPLDDDPLSTEEIKVFEQWIAEGAKWSKHWAYVPLKKNIKVPDNCISHCSNSIDHFIQEKQKIHGLRSSAEANKTTLIRRLYLDLIGLPPSLEAVTEFVSDTAPSAYENLVDQLLRSEHYGEKWASMWLDLARYADSKGYQKDLLRPEMWRYRDWVIHAFNNDLPFDQFTIDQLAGDLVPNHDSNQLLATAFHRNTMTNDEGGTDDEEYRVAAVIDRTNATMEIWQGITMGCVQCHSHPYDPIRHEDYYQVMAFFNTTADRDLYSDTPLANLLSPDQLSKKEHLERALDNIKMNGDTLSKTYREHLENYINILPGAIPIMSELDTMRETHVFERGNWLVHGEKVEPNTPSSLSDFDERYEKNRYGLAKWLINKENPLTARVIVNRFWEQIFGTGIVPTLEDFGTQSEKASHPELLDYLASNFMNEHSWSMKGLIKEMVMSATYRQSSNLSDEFIKKDPENIYLARGPRYRLSAEQIRDQALAIGGLLNRTVYGKSVMPFQPDGVWNVIRHAAKWKIGEDGDQHRRGLYTFWRRVSPYPSMLTFDVPSRELCVSRRIRTNTPLQALTTLNDPVFVEAAHGLAERMKVDGGKTITEKINYGFQVALMRPPDRARQKVLLDFYKKNVDLYEKGKFEKMEIMDQGLYEIASIILNLDEVLMKT